MKILNDSSDVPEARLGILILLSRGRMGTAGCVNKRAEGKRVCGRFRSLYAYGQ